MSKPVQILIVEDEMIIGATISLHLTNAGYEVIGIIPGAEEVLPFIESTPPDIILLDIQLKGEMDGIEMASLMQEQYDIPIIYLTANSDQAHFERAKSTRPFAFISKPFKKQDILRAIELTISRIASPEEMPEPEGDPDAPFILSDRIFVRHRERMVKIFIESILYVEAERNYCRIFTKEKEYLLATPLKTMEEKLPAAYFLRVHRSFMVNIAQVDEVSEHHLVIGRKAIPLSKNSKEELQRRIQMI
ncbi:LytR/AlgR family response regulator transcription factor [Flavilitoribacter nigricans]|uniref:DNA-binding response regulator n=1 Tax=Flavilitoribacter nigricans (strain ATCC 23147 / DSM 23189 / NBRC 102662 / NCIMB 1420 / SS-2) TaxID=1122177 RepID=A0A2D0N587_FLAN2|nr:LytTR family transcriptional regulator DNA-binding domain-containing protein [Flavilitoribacter nigricans]PHN03702.1 DNA-binding response regulator [Flavilitoribacter nigricans DSM 23189 = NBRC 102662]